MRPPQIPPEFRTWTMSDGYAVRGRVWPPRAPGGTVGFLYLHGIQSHGGWYEWSASLLAASGHLVLLPDRRGSGLNDAARGDTPAARRWLDDLDDLAAWAAHEFGVRRFGVVGVSWGGKVAVAWTLRRAERVERLLLIAPGLFPAVDIGFGTKLRVAMCVLARRSTRFEVPLNDPALFTDNPAGRQFIACDPLKLESVTARFLYRSRQLDRPLQRDPRGALQPPLTLFLAERDRIIRNDATQAWARRVAGPTAPIAMFPGAAHTLEFEPDPLLFAERLRHWVAEFRAT